MLTARNARYPRFLGLPNLLNVPYAFVSGQEYSPTYAALNVLSIDPAKKWRSPDLEWGNTNLRLTWGRDGDSELETFPVASFQIDAFGLVNHNLWDGTGQFRIVCSDDYTLDGDLNIERLSPINSSNLTNVDGDHEDLGDGDVGIGPDTPGSGWSINLLMSNTVETPRPAQVDTGANPYNDLCYHWIAIRARVDDAPADIPQRGAPTIQLLLSDGVNSFAIVNNVKPVTVARPDGQWLFFLFHAPVGWDGAGLTVSVDASVGTEGEDARILECYLMAETDSITGSSAVVYDSGWLPGGAGYMWFANNPLALYQNPGLVPRRDSYIPFVSAPTGVRSIVVAFRDDHVRHLTDTYINLLSTVQPPQYVEFGHAVTGLEFVPENGIMTAQIGRTDHSTKGLTDGLATFGQRLGTRRYASIPLRVISAIESGFIDERILERGYLSPYMVSIFPGPVTEANMDNRWGSMFVTTKNADNVIAHREVDTAAFPRSMTLAVEEYK